MASNDNYPAYESPLKKSKIKDSIHGEGPVSQPKIVGSSVAEQVEYKLNIRTTKKKSTATWLSTISIKRRKIMTPMVKNHSGGLMKNKDHVKLLDKYDRLTEESDVLISTLCLGGPD